MKNTKLALGIIVVLTPLVTFAIEKTRPTDCIEVYKRYVEQREYSRELEIVYKSCLLRFPDLADQLGRQRDSDRRAEEDRRHQEGERRNNGYFNYSFDEIANHPNNSFNLPIVHKVIRYKFRGTSNGSKVMGEITPDEACNLLGHKESTSFETKTYSDYEHEDFLGVYRKKTFLSRGSLEKFTFKYLNEDNKAQDAEVFVKLSCRGKIESDLKLVEVINSIAFNKEEKGLMNSDDKRDQVGRSPSFINTQIEYSGSSISK
ncbi:MAG: hypothetical protein COW00_06720 [Bdellovibrio sp. CG12_big_fil_rev_8_21_14_0_65_39_13]|nr:MAG: hypothetical protein COW78_04215 [Bdellovibrio sp. CG22_combo_CG10-13_8_21_14_all_39_27]PIQ60445.1 MAG: hypothetical protein COW00_06720 [Bdellovibrio sp. CG12_big_fil_rev_8_21_14_0_65_39_13]PIR34968.1 MAG: hypothetical protein COV37_11020 [Bdellovibrio sp. CG11_big_fil_rev_8_21_14_0_20_39_38]